jgi:HEAT repeat protein
VLLKSLDDKSPIVRGAAMQTLARLGAKEAVQPIADMLADRQGRVGASKALQAMGPIAEEAVLKQLKNDEWIVRHEACKVLGAIGTAKGVKLLKKLEADPNLLVRRSAKQAIQKIEKRKTTGKPAAST